MHWLYVYYRLPETLADAVQAEVAAYFARLDMAWSADTGSMLQPRLLRRPELRDGDVTFMEVYGPVEADALDAVRAHIAACLPNFPMLSSATRHTEHFIGLSCA